MAQEGTKDVSQAQIRTDVDVKDSILIVNAVTKEVQQLPIEALPIPEGGGNPDEEDITLTEIDGEEKLQFKDRVSGESTDGLKINRIENSGAVNSYEVRFIVEQLPTIDGSSNATLTIDGVTKSMPLRGVDLLDQVDLSFPVGGISSDTTYVISITSENYRQEIPLIAANNTTGDMIAFNVISALSLPSGLSAIISPVGTNRVRIRANRPASGYNNSGVSVTTSRITSFSPRDDMDRIKSRLMDFSWEGYDSIELSNGVAFRRKLLSSTPPTSLVNNASSGVRFVTSVVTTEEFDDLPTLNEFSENTLHTIRYEFNLLGKIMDIPTGVTIHFDGGYIKNAILVGNKTKITSSSLRKLFHEDVQFQGSWQIEAVPIEWFGATSVTNDGWSTAETQFVRYHPSVRELPDSSEAINMAINLAKLTSGKVHAASGVYRCEDTVDLIDNTTIYIPSNSAICWSNMSGSGFMNEGDTEPVYALASNKFIPTTSMAKCINMSSQGARIEGMGTLAFSECTYTIGIYMRGKWYMAADMQFAPHVSIKTIGGDWGQTGADLDTIIGDVDPTSDIGVQGNTYLNKTTRRMFSKGASNWSFMSDANARFNTSVRFEVNASDLRIINMDFDIWDMYGYRGIEFVQSAGGWCNQSYFKGTISNKISNFISFYNDPSPSLQGEWSRHDLTAMCYQIDSKMTKECRIIYADRLRFSKIGEAWDLWWFRSNLRSQLKYELGARSEGNTIPIDQNYTPFLSDLGINNNTIAKLDRFAPNNVGFSTFENIFKYNTPRALGFAGTKRYQQYPSFIVDPLLIGQQIRDSVVIPGQSSDQPPLQLFDEDYSTSFDVIDTDNDKWGAGLALLEGDGNWIGRQFNDSYIEIDYVVNPQLDATLRGGDVGMRAALFVGDNNNQIRLENEYVITNQRYSNVGVTGGFGYASNKLYIRVGLNSSLRRLYLGFYINNEPSTQQVLRVKTIKFWFNNPSVIPKQTKYGTTANRPNAAPKGHIYSNTTTSALEVNMGTSSEPDWKNITIS